MFRFKIIVVLIGCFFCGCRNDKFKPITKVNNIANPPTNVCGSLANVSFSAQVQPILNNNCVNCHNTFSGLKLSDYSHVASLANNGQLSGSLNGNTVFLQMPLNANMDSSLVMDSCSIKTILNWINQGSLNN